MGHSVDSRWRGGFVVLAGEAVFGRGVQAAKPVPQRGLGKSFLCRPSCHGHRCSEKSRSMRRGMRTGDCPSIRDEFQEPISGPILGIYNIIPVPQHIAAVFLNRRVAV
jgi:hypothetical protein